MDTSMHIGSAMTVLFLNHRAKVHANLQDFGILMHRNHA